MPSLGALTTLNPPSTRPIARLATSHPSWPVGLVLPIAAIGVLAAGVSLLAPSVGSRTLFEILLFPVLVAALLFGVRAGLGGVAVSAVLATLARAALGAPWIADPSHLPELAVFLAEGVAFTLIGGVVRSAARAIAMQDRSTAPSVPNSGHEPELLRSAGPIGPMRLEHLTRREAEILQQAAGGRSVDELAAELSISPNTVKTHLAHCYDKLGAHNRAEAVALAVHFGSLVTEDLEAALPQEDG